MATWDITAPSGSGVGGTGSNTSAITPPGDFDGATIDSVVLIGTPTLTGNENSNDDFWIRWYIANTAGTDIYGGDGADADSIVYFSSGDFSTTPANLSSGGAPTPAPTTAVAADWDDLKWNYTYTVSGKDDASTVSWDSFTIRVTYSPVGGSTTEEPLLGELDLLGYVPISFLPLTEEPGTASPSPAITGYEPTVQIGLTTLPTTRALALSGKQAARWTGLWFEGYAPTATVEEGGDALTELPLLGTLALSGKLPVTVVNHVAAPTVGALALGVAGNDPEPIQGQVEQPLLGTLALGIAGSAPTVIHDRVTDVPLGTLTIGELTPTGSVGNVVLPGLDALVLGVAGNDPSIVQGQVEQPLLGTLALGIAGSEPEAIIANVREPSTDALVLGVVGSDPTVSVGDLREPAIDTLVLAGVVPTVSVANVTEPAIDTLVLTGYAPTVSVGEVELPTADSLTLAGVIPTVQHNRLSDVPVGSLTLSGKVPTVGGAGTASPTVDSLTLAGLVPTVAVANVVTPGIDTLTLAGAAPTTGDSLVENPLLGSLALSGIAPTAVVANDIPVPLGTLTLSGKTPEITSGNTVEIPTGSINIYKYVGLKLQGIPPTLSIADVVDPTTGAVQIERVLYSGTHNGGAGDPVLYTFPLELPIDDLIGYVVRNLTDGSEAVITDNDNNQVFGQLTGGTDNDWDPGDLFEITTGTPPSLNVTVFPTVGALTLSGAVPTALGAVFPATGALTFRGYATIDQDTVAPSVGALTLSGAAPTLKGVEQPTTGSLTCTGYAPTVDYQQSPDVSVGSLALAGIAPTAVVSQPVLPTTGALALASDPPEVADTGAIITLKGSLALTGQAPSVQVKSWADPGSDSLVISGIPPTVEVLTTPSYTIEVGTASLVLISTVQTEEPTAGSLTLEGQPVSIFYRDGTFIENPNATTAVPSNYEQCDYSGFRVMPGSLKMTWNKHAVRKKSYESRHPQDTLRSIPEKRKGSRRPEREDTFIDTLYPDGVDSEDL